MCDDALLDAAKAALESALNNMRFALIAEFLDAAETLAWRTAGNPVAFEAQMLELVRSTARFWTEREQMLAKVEARGNA